MNIGFSCLLVVLFTVAVSQTVPSWNMPLLNPIFWPYGGAQPFPNTTYTRLFYATREIGTYNMAPMLSYFNGMFLATWKNAIEGEDQDGQRVLYSQSKDGITWTTGVRELFPNISVASHHAHLFAEPTLILNGNVYAAASPTQFCLYPDQYQDVLLRQVFSGYDSFGPIFWASQTIPKGWEENSAVHKLSTLSQMPASVQADIKLLSNPMTRPCDPSGTQPGHTSKCEYCTNGCQNWNDTKKIPSIENERSHYLLPNGGDVILYRSKSKDLPNHLYASTRASPTATWQGPFLTNITDDVANINCGNLPDGRAYLVSNAMVNLFRDPLYLSVTDKTNLRFVETHVIVSCEMPIFSSPNQPIGCLQRYQGRAKQGGCQYAQGLVVNGKNMYVIFSLNKEDIWIATIPFSEI